MRVLALLCFCFFTHLPCLLTKPLRQLASGFGLVPPVPLKVPIWGGGAAWVAGAAALVGRRARRLLREA